MSTAFRRVLVFVGVFLALVLTAGLIGLLGSWELLVIAGVAAAVTVLVGPSGVVRRPRDGAAH